MKPTIQRVRETLADLKSRTATTLTLELNVTRPTVAEALRILHETGEIHISDFDYSVGGPCAALWKAGAGEDAKRRTGAANDRNRRYRLRKALEQEAGRRAAELARPPFRHWQDEALFGPTSK